MTKYIELIDKYEIRQSDSDEYNPPSYIWTDNTGEIIRCKDCKHWDGYYCHNRWYGDGYGNYAPPIKSKDGFCDLAKRKEG